jgi:hypothetical protein
MNMNQNLNEVQGKLVQWAVRTSHLIGNVFDDCSNHFTPSSFQSDQECQVLWQLNASCHATGESALILIGNIRLWDADVLVRSVVEGTLKFVFLTFGSLSERRVKLCEFDDDFAAIGQIRRHQRLKDFLSVVENPDADEWRPFRDLLLSEKQLDELQKKYPKASRQKLNQKWSFAEICLALRRSGQPGYEHLGHMLYNYGMSSHIAHQDIDGIGMVWDRNKRNAARRTAVELAHGGRLIGDIGIMTLLRAKTLFKLWNSGSAILKPHVEELDLILKDTAAAGEEFHDIEYGTDIEK